MANKLVSQRGLLLASAPLLSAQKTSKIRIAYIGKKRAKLPVVIDAAEREIPGSEGNPAMAGQDHANYLSLNRSRITFAAEASGRWTTSAA